MQTFMVNRVVCVAAVVCLAGVTAGQEAARAVDYAAINARVEKFVEEKDVVGLSYALIVEGKVVRTGHHGWEDREEKIPASDATMYRWASISKPLTAVGVMQLWELGKIDLDADVRLLVPEFPDKGKAITTRQLLTHQGGVVHYVNGPVVKSPPPDGVANPYKDVVIALGMFDRSPLVCEPGEKHSYTTHGYMLVGAALERAGKAPYAEQITRRICTPLGLATLRPDYQWEVIPHRAVGYRKRADEMVRSTDTDVSWKLAGGGWISTVGDLAGFGVGVMGSELLREETKRLMWTDQPARDGKPTGYGLGWRVVDRGGTQAVLHSGSQEKAATFLLLIPSKKAGVALMSNTEGTSLGELANELATAIAP